MAHYEIHYFLIQAGFFFELRHIKRIGQAANIQHDIGFFGKAEFKAEADDIQRHRLALALQKQIANALFVLGRGKQRGVDHIIGTLIQRLQDRAFHTNGLAHGKAMAQADGMHTAGFFIAPFQAFIRGIQKQDLIVDL